MSDTPKSEPAVPATTTPAEPVVVSESATTAPSSAEPAASERAADRAASERAVAEADPAPVAEPAPVVVEPAPVVVERKKRGLGAWSFILGLLTGLIDIAFVVWVVVVLVGTIGDLQAGNLEAMSTAISAAGLVIVALFVFFGGFVSAGLAVVLGLVALVSGRGRVLGVVGLLFGAAAIVVRLLLLSAGFSPDLG